MDKSRAEQLANLFIRFGDLDPSVQQFFIRMDSADVEQFKRLTTVLHTEEDVDRFKRTMKMISYIETTSRLLRIGFIGFAGAVALVYTTGDQLGKIWTWLSRLLKLS